MNDPIDNDLLKELINKLEIKEFKEKDKFSQVMYLLKQLSNIIEKNTNIMAKNSLDINEIQKHISTLENKIKELEVNK
tara:strand:- start:31 stop:264 length:234 start_codon:yes stop_codon:yes gene_type:complete